MVDVDRANHYFATEVLHTNEWDEATEDQKIRALKNAENLLYRVYKNYDLSEKPLPEIAVFEQSLWLLRIDDTIRKAEQGVTSINVKGISINLSRAPSNISPEVISIMGRRIGRSVIS